MKHAMLSIVWRYVEEHNDLKKDKQVVVALDWAHKSQK